MILLNAFLCLLAGVLLISANQVKYHDYKVFKVWPTSVAQRSMLYDLHEVNNQYGFWRHESVGDDSLEMIIPPQLVKSFSTQLKAAKVRYKVVINNVQDAIDAASSNNTQEGMNWLNYHRLDTINDWLADLAEHNEHVTLLKIGKSYQKRDITGVHISFGPQNENRSVFLEGSIHAREWISSATVTYILNEILAGGGAGNNNSKINEMVMKYDWYIFPVLNPDGYEYSHTTDRLWRKTRRPYGFCYGADPNRNWNFKFLLGASINFCSELYAGPQPFSEPETKSMSNFLTTIAHKLIAYFDFHSYSQLIMLPYGYTKKHLDNYDELYEVGVLGAASLAERYGTEYKVGNIAELLYPSGGNSLDWLKYNFNTRITYAIELRDTGTHGFLLPPEQIVPTALETLDALVTIMNEFENRPVT